jgi:hypothetical protein
VILVILFYACTVQFIYSRHTDSIGTQDTVHDGTIKQFILCFLEKGRGTDFSGKNKERKRGLKMGIWIPQGMNQEMIRGQYSSGKKYIWIWGGVGFPREKRGKNEGSRILNGRIRKG